MDRRKMQAAVSTGLLIFSLLLMAVSRNVIGFADWYRLHIYSRQAEFWSRLYGFLPFSASELFLSILIVWIFVRLVIHIRRCIGKKEKWKQMWTGELLFWYGTACFLFFLFAVHSGVNYSAVSFSEEHGLKREGYTVEELIQVCNIFAEDLNELAYQVKRGEDLVFLEPERSENMSVDAMEDLGEVYQGLAGSYPVPKGLVLSSLFSYENITGIYSPFTIEANYNREIIPYNIPFTMCHELSHLRGYMKEDEANFIAWLACRDSYDLSFVYSGTVMGWIYCGNELYRYDRETYRKLRESLPEAVKADLEANNKFWDEHEGLMADMSEKVNDTYLKINQQKAGIEAYDQVVDLIVSTVLEEE